MSEHYPRPDVRTKEEILAHEEASLANFDRLQRFFVLGRFINRDALLPRRHRALFLSAIGLMLLGVFVLVAGMGYFIESLHNASQSNNLLVLFGALSVFAILCAVPLYVFPFRRWSGSAVLPAVFGGSWRLWRLAAMSPGICFSFGLFFLLHETGLGPFAGLAFGFVVPLSLVVIYGIALWRTTKFVGEGFEERWIEEKMGRQEPWVKARRSGGGEEMSEHYPRPSLINPNTREAQLQAHLAKFDEFQLAMIRAGFVKRDALVPRSHRLAFLVAVTLGIGACALLCSTLFLFDRFESVVPELISGALLLLLVTLCFPWRYWLGRFTDARDTRSPIGLTLRLTGTFVPILCGLATRPLHGARSTSIFLIVMGSIVGLTVGLSIFSILRTSKFVMPAEEAVWMDTNFKARRLGWIWNLRKSRAAKGL